MKKERKRRMDTAFVTLCNNSWEPPCLLFFHKQKQPGCVNKTRKLEIRKEKLSRQLWKLNNSTNVGRTEKASQWENAGWDLERTRKTQKVKEKSLKGALSSWAEQDWIVKWGKGDLHLKKKNLFPCFWRSDPWELLVTEQSPWYLSWIAPDQKLTFHSPQLSHECPLWMPQEGCPSFQSQKNMVEKADISISLPYLVASRSLWSLSSFHGPVVGWQWWHLRSDRKRSLHKRTRWILGFGHAAFPMVFRTHQHFILPRATAAKGLGSHFYESASIHLVSTALHNGLVLPCAFQVSCAWQPSLTHGTALMPAGPALLRRQEVMLRAFSKHPPCQPPDNDKFWFVASSKALQCSKKTS